MTEILENMSDIVEDTLKEKYLTFTLDREEYGIEIRYVTEIIGLQSITEVPEMPEYVKGIINLRGKIIPVIDVRLRFKKDSRDYNDRTCIVVVDINENPIGLIVDTVSEVLSIPDGEIVPPPGIGAGFHQRYIKGIGKDSNGVKLLLDCEKLLNEKEVESLKNIS